MQESASPSPEVDRLCQLISDAFAGVKLGKGVGLEEGQAIDAYADAETRERFRARDEKDDWRRLPVKRLNDWSSSLCFFDAAGMRFHLPAFLIADLQGNYRQSLEFCLTHSSDYSIGQFKLLDDSQRQAVRAYLLYISKHPGYKFSHPQILSALETYWVA